MQKSVSDLRFQVRTELIQFPKCFILFRVLHSEPSPDTVFLSAVHQCQNPLQFYVMEESVICLIQYERIKPGTVHTFTYSSLHHNS